MTDAEAQRILALLGTAFPDGWRFLDPDQQRDTRRLWRDMLRDLDYVLVDAATRRIIATHKKMPSIAEMRAMYSRQAYGRDDRGGQAWGAILKLIGRYGAYRSPGVDFQIEDPVLARVVDALGWRELCLSENATADRARVIELYEQLVLHDAEDRAVGAIAPPIPQRRHSIETGEARTLGDIVGKMLPSTTEE